MLSRLSLLRDIDKNGRFLAPAAEDAPISFWRPRNQKARNSCSLSLTTRSLTNRRRNTSLRSSMTPAPRPPLSSTR